jgi:uncharacterized membrane protein
MTVVLGVWGSPEWARPAGILLAAGVVALAWGYWRATASRGVIALAAMLKSVGLVALALCLVDPLLTGVRPRPGANIFAVVSDDSQSMQIRDSGDSISRGAALQRALLAESSWQTRLGQDFDVRRLAFHTQVRAIDDFSALSFDGVGSSVPSALEALSRRFRGLPVAGVLLMTDGNSTQNVTDGVPWSDLPPVYPVVVGDGDDLQDVSIDRVSISETNFDAAPVTVRADLRTTGYGRTPLVAKLLDEHGDVEESKTVSPARDNETASVRFQLRPEGGRVSFYRVEAHAEGNEPSPKNGAAAADDSRPDEAGFESDDAALANNGRLIAVDGGRGPYRVLYVGGRPNWEFKFLRRALDDDDQLELVGLVRIARHEPKFSFRRRGEQSTNQLFEGFDHPEEDTAEQYDEPVLVRLGTQDENDLRDGFPRTAEELYRYHAVVLDDVGAEFFSQDQLTLLEDFVSRRGGGLLMLGGPESFGDGKYSRTPVGDALPVYVDRDNGAAALPRDQGLRLALTREGWIEPWVRLRKTEPEDRRRLASMPAFESVSPVGNLKPGASVLASVIDSGGVAHPALAAQRYGRGRSAALLIGDLWRWGLHDDNDRDPDLAKSWRQTVRWLVADAPQRVEVETRPDADSTGMTLQVRVFDEKYLPLDNAEVKVRVTMPDGKAIELETEPGDAEAGSYAARLVPRMPGAYRAAVEAAAPDGSPIGQRELGWAAQPLADEFNRLAPNRRLLEEIAAKTGGEVIEMAELDDFVAGLNSRKAPITEPWTRPLWHHPLFFLITITCLCAEWGLRRWKGLP